MTYFVVDCEATEKTPVSGVLTEFGVVEVESLEHFYGKLWDSKPSTENPAIPVLDGHGQRYDARLVLHALNEYLSGFPKPWVFVSDNPAYDFMWIACLCDSEGFENPFGHSGRRIGDFAAGLEREWTAAHSWKRLRDTPHTHNPVDDARGNAEALRKLLRIAGQG